MSASQPSASLYAAYAFLSSWLVVSAFWIKYLKREIAMLKEERGQLERLVDEQRFRQDAD